MGFLEAVAIVITFLIFFISFNYINAQANLHSFVLKSRGLPARATDHCHQQIS